MNFQYCSQCGSGLMRTMRMCPTCGGKVFGDSPPPNASFSPHASSTATFGAALGKTALGAGQFEPAAHWNRFLAYVLDYVFILVVSFFVAFIATLMGTVGSLLPGASVVTGLGLLLGAALPFIYFTVLHASPKGASWGKSLLGLRVVTVHGERLTKTQSFIRILLQSLLPIAGYVVLAISLVPMAANESTEMNAALAVAALCGMVAIFIGPFIMVYFNPQRQTLFDQICKTQVIKK